MQRLFAIPPTWISLLFGSGKGWSILLAALLGIPFYLNIFSSLPIAHAFIAHGATPGAAMAFLLPRLQFALIDEL